jgi:predicted aconitase with swiveling domain
MTREPPGDKRSLFNPGPSSFVISEAFMSETIVLHGRVIKAGRGEGPALVSSAPIGFLGGVDPETGVVLEPGHPLQGKSIAGKVLVFPTGKGSTVGSYTILRLGRGGHGPAAMINVESEAIVAVGAIIADIPMVDRIDISLIRDGDWVVVADDKVTVAS